VLPRTEIISSSRHTVLHINMFLYIPWSTITPQSHSG
jgi:hypothetical protein